MDISKCSLTLFGDTNSEDTRCAIEILDRSGLAYRIQAPSESDQKLESDGVRRSFPMVVAGEQILSPITRQDLIEFLWEHGARFEDS